MKPRLLDLFCKAGGTTTGYQRAGFYVVGVDIEPQPNYCGEEFVQMDALQCLSRLLLEDATSSEPDACTLTHIPVDEVEGVGLLSDFDAIHASPPCQAHVTGLAGVNRARGRTLHHTDLIAATRKRLKATGLPYVIENVVGAPLIEPVELCGSSFGLPIRRHRLFETSFPVMVSGCNHSWQNEAKYPTNWRPNGEKRLAKVVQVYGNAAGTDLWGPAMGIDWMKPAELAEAIPPAYTEHIGRYLMAEVNRRAKQAA